MDISFILYKPSVPENIGSAARAIKTMGFSNLRLILPCDHLSTGAMRLAHGSSEILYNAMVFSSFEDAIVDIDYIIATTAKKRSAKEDYLSPSEVKTQLENKSSSIRKAAIVFGTEESGLPNNIISSCDLATTLPLATSYPSLNLGQAVMLYAYELATKEQEVTKDPIGKITGFKELKERVKEILGKIGIPDEMPLYQRILERLSTLNDTDIHLLHSVSSRIINKLNAKNYP